MLQEVHQTIVTVGVGTGYADPTPNKVGLGQSVGPKHDRHYHTYMSGSPGWKTSIIPSRISIASLRSKGAIYLSFCYRWGSYVLRRKPHILTLLRSVYEPHP